MTRQDLCDARCPAAAQHIVHTKAGPLLLCTHHLRKHEAALLIKGCRIETPGKVSA